MEENNTVHYGTICKALRKEFQHSIYKLNEAYVFRHDWESDFFCMMDSGYFVEVEIKLSRSDFLADFKKYKHPLFKGLMQKKEIIVTNKGRDSNENHHRLICEVKSKELRNIRAHDWGCWSGEKQEIYSSGRYERNSKGQYGYLVNNMEDFKLYDVVKKHYAPATRIEFINLKKMLIPNQFYFAAPAGMLKAKDIPDYAGWIEVHDETHVKKVKRAPYLHKEKLHARLMPELLKKFHHIATSQYFTHKYQVDLLNSRIEQLEKQLQAAGVDPDAEPLIKN